MVEPRMGNGLVVGIGLIIVIAVVWMVVKE